MLALSFVRGRMEDFHQDGWVFLEPETSKSLTPDKILFDDMKPDF